MITYENPATVYRAVPPKDSRPEKRSQLVAHWIKIDGKLVCRWVSVPSSLEQ